MHVSGTSLNRSCKFLTMEFFIVVCGLLTPCFLVQHDVIIFLAGWSVGPHISFPMKSSCHAAIIFLTHGIA
jgi:hypothetical protein